MPSCKISPNLFLLILEIVVHLNTQYKVHVPTKKDIDSITARIFSNEEEVKRMTHQLISEKLLVLYKEKVNKKITETSYEKYIELAYKKND